MSNKKQEVKSGSEKHQVQTTVRQEEYYCDCTNPECCMGYMIMDIDKSCPKCGSSVEPSQCDSGW